MIDLSFARGLAAATIFGCIAFPGFAEQELGQAANDPTASLMSFQLQNFYAPNVHLLPDEEQNTLQFRAAIPWTIGGVNNIFRITTPYATKTPSNAQGFNDTTLFNLAAFDRAWGRWGAGVVAVIPSWEDGLSSRKYGLGPALGFVAQEDWGLWGVFNQNVFSVGGDSDARDLNISTIQPILNVSLGQGWSIGTSEMTIIYDWEADDFVSLPVGVKLSKLVKPGLLPIPTQYQLSYERNLYDNAPIGKDVWGLTVKLLVPK